MLLRTSRPDANNKTCIEYVGLRAKALPLHRPMEFQQGVVHQIISPISNSEYTIFLTNI